MIVYSKKNNHMDKMKSFVFICFCFSVEIVTFAEEVKIDGIEKREIEGETTIGESLSVFQYIPIYMFSSHVSL